MRNLILTLCLVCGIFASQAQTKGDWYIGTGDIANVSWTEWSVSPTVGFGLTSDLVIGCSVSQADSSADMDIDFNARYFINGYFAYVATDGLDFDSMTIGLGKMFDLKENIYVDPKLVYNTGEGTTNLTLGFGFRF